MAGGVAIAASIIAGHPDYGAGVFGPWWIAGITLGLVAVGAGLVAVLQHSILPATIKAAVVAITVTAVAAFAFVGVELLPTTLPSCGTVERPTLENRGPVYCKEGNGTVVRMSISSVELCPGGHFIADFNRGERGGIWPLYWWLETGVASSGVCRL